MFERLQGAMELKNTLLPSINDYIDLNFYPLSNAERTKYYKTEIKDLCQASEGDNKLWIRYFTNYRKWLDFVLFSIGPREMVEFLAIYGFAQHIENFLQACESNVMVSIILSFHFWALSSLKEWNGKVMWMFNGVEWALLSGMVYQMPVIGFHSRDLNIDFFSLTK